MRGSQKERLWKRGARLQFKVKEEVMCIREGCSEQMNKIHK